MSDSLLQNPTLKISGPIVELILNNPDRKNALSLAGWQRIPDLLNSLKDNKDLRVCVVKGAGGAAFCAGADISEFEAVRSTPEAAAHYDQTNVDAFKAIRNLPIPVIALIEGPCLGGGLGIALACDIRISSKDASFGIPAARLGLAYPPDALPHLLEAVSASNAKKLLFSADRYSAEDACAMGLVDEVHDTGNLAERVASLSDTICRNAPLSLGAAKRTINLMSERAANADLEEARLLAKVCVESEDYAEGCSAFLEKRRPSFKGE